MSNLISEITNTEFSKLRDLVKVKSGIHLADHKKCLLYNRLYKRLEDRDCGSFTDYYHLINQPAEAQEKELFFELLTTNETYFFREPQHFDFLKGWIKAYDDSYPFRVWSAASSTGEEVYSIAMTLAESPLKEWNVLGTDINRSVLNSGKNGIYSDYRSEGIPDHIRFKYCEKGINKYKGSFRIRPEIRKRVFFEYFNLISPTQINFSLCDVIFMRNVMIYFEKNNKVEVIENVSQKLKPKGVLIVSHSESLHGLTDSFNMIAPGVYQRKY